ncbi:hypothetical protein [Actinotignum sp. GS-2025b]|uniref:hypothetical protein n=1 Tax=Actinotignum sp. GS-2025b TaxID=3427275 RepID=UPI003F472886
MNITLRRGNGADGATAQWRHGGKGTVRTVRRPMGAVVVRRRRSCAARIRVWGGRLSLPPHTPTTQAGS